MQIPIDAASEHFLCLIEFQLLANARGAMFDFANITRASASLRLYGCLSSVHCVSKTKALKIKKSYLQQSWQTEANKY